MDSLFGIPMDSLMIVCLLAFGAMVAALAALALTNRIFVKLSLRNIGRRKGRTVLIVAGLMLGTAIIAAAFTTGDTMSNTIRSTALTSLGHIDETISVEGASADQTLFVQTEGGDVRYFDQSLFPKISDAVADSELVDGLTPAIIEAVAVQNPAARRNEPRTTVFAADPERMDGFGEIREEGGGAVTLKELGEGDVFLNAEAADELDAGAGDQVLVFAAGRSVPVRVAAIVDYRGTGTDESAVLMSLRAAQRLLDAEGEIKHVLVSNRGDALSGVDHTQAVIDRLEPTLTPLGLEAEPSKEDALELADLAGDTFTTIFATFGSFSIIAGILLIFLIFVMLAEERKSEMGMARAVGTQREHLVQMFLYEGVAYDLVAAAAGAAVGVGVAFGMVFLMAQAIAAFGLDIQHDVQPRSIIVAYTLGVLLTLVVVTISAWRVSVLNIVRAVRNLPEPVLRRGQGKAWLLGVLAVALGVLLAFAGLSAEQAAPFYLGVSLVVVAAIPLLRRLGAPDRVAYTVTGLALVVLWLLPFDAFDFILPQLSADFSLFILSGVFVVTGATWTVMYNSDLLLGFVQGLFGRIRFLAPVLKTAITYPLTSRFRTGMTLAMFTLVVFTVVVMTTTNSSFTEAFDDVETYGGGFDIHATTVNANPIADMRRAVAESEELDVEDFEVFASQSFLPMDVRQGDVEGAEFETYPVRGLSDEFIQNNNYDLATIAEGYESAEEVWQAIGEDPGLAVIDPLPVPRRNNYGFAAGGDFRLEGFYYEDDSFEPVPIDVVDPQTGTSFEVTIIGVLTEAVEFDFVVGISTSQTRLASALGERATPTIHMLRLAEGVDARATADSLESAFLANGMEAKAVEERLEDAVAANQTFNYILQGFMGLGLIVGVAAIGVIAARSVVERRQQIGVLRAIGFERPMVQLSFLLESSFVALVGIVLGTVLGLVIAFNVIEDTRQQGGWDNLSFTVPWLNLLVVFVIVYAAALVASYLPARQASRVFPAEALRYE